MSSLFNGGWWSILMVGQTWCDMIGEVDWMFKVILS